MSFQVIISFVSFLTTILNFAGLFILRQIAWNFVYGFFESHFVF